MRALVPGILIAAMLGSTVRAEVNPVSISAPETTAWTGELVHIIVELKANGSFSGSASFDIPEIPGTLLVKTGSPVIGSKEIEGEDWFVQTHGFALFSQKTGSIEIPSFPVRFECREGFTGPVKQVTAETEPLTIEIRRPPGSEDIPFLVTTESFDLSETWEPVPESAAVGDVFRRTIVQRADGLTGMALLPASTNAPEGVRVYPPKVETNDNTERGAFEGERRETLTYLLQQSGAITLPELIYTWWNPKSEKLESKSLPAITVQVAAAPVTELSSAVSSSRWIGWIIAVAAVLIFVWQRQCLSNAMRKTWRILDPPEQAAARHLRRACIHNDAEAAGKAWNQWSILAGYECGPGSELHASVLEMQSVLYGSSNAGAWSGATLREEFQKERNVRRRMKARPSDSFLPPLNFPNKLI